MKPCDKLGKKGKPCNLCCVFDFPYLILNKQDVPVQLSDRKPTLEEQERGKKLGLKIPRNARYCAHSMNGKCDIYNTDNVVVNQVCKKFKCDAYEKMEATL